MPKNYGGKMANSSAEAFVIAVGFILFMIFCFYLL